MNLGLGFYKTGVIDLEIAKLLYNKEFYPNSIYHLQQSVEKLAKSYGLFNGIIQHEELEKRIRHNSNKVFTTEIQDFQNKIIKVEEFAHVFPEFFKFSIDGIEHDFTKIDSQFKKSIILAMNFEPNDFHSISCNDLDEILQIIKTSQDLIIDSEFNFEKFEKQFPVICNKIIKQIEVKTGEDLEYLINIFKNHMFTKNEISELFLHLLKVNSVSLSLYLFALLTASHNQATRYPCLCCGELPKNNYNMETSIIIKFNNLIAIYEKTIKCFEEIYITDN